MDAKPFVTDMADRFLRSPLVNTRFRLVRRSGQAPTIPGLNRNGVVRRPCRVSLLDEVRKQESGHRSALPLRPASPIPQLRRCGTRANIPLAKIHQSSALLRDAHRLLRSGPDRRGARGASAWRAILAL